MCRHLLPGDVSDLEITHLDALCPGKRRSVSRARDVRMLEPKANSDMVKLWNANHVAGPSAAVCSTTLSLARFDRSGRLGAVGPSASGTQGSWRSVGGRRPARRGRAQSRSSCGGRPEVRLARVHADVVQWGCTPFNSTSTGERDPHTGAAHDQERALNVDGNRCWGPGSGTCREPHALQ